MTPPTTSDLIFSEQANHNFSKTLADLKRHTLSIHNRLRSILEDAAFVQKVSAAYGRPLIANERCGSWYIDPKQKDSSAYFKSTDGHTGVWSFSTRRLNAHLLEAIGKHDGCIVVDSTRRGKRMPDAMSKTIPIWCSVLNRALFPDRIEYHDLYTPPQVVSFSEHEQITTRLDSFLQSMLALDIDLTKLQAQITKPLRPVWVTPESHIQPVNQVFEDYHPVICCTASRRVSGGEVSEGGYIQGSGDDTENWAFGLTPSVFWANTQLLFSTPETELPELIPKLAASSVSPLPSLASKLAYVPPANSLHITTLSMLTSPIPDSGKVIISLYSDVTPDGNYQLAAQELKIGLGPHKLGSRNLRTVLPTIVDFVTKRTAQSNQEDNSECNIDIIIACSSGKDHSVGVGLALLCLFFDDNGQFRALNNNEGIKKIDKPFIRRRLGRIMTAMPDANPSGATLQSVNSYLMARPS